MDKVALRSHLADLDERKLHNRHEFALLKLVRAARNPDTLDSELEDAALAFLQDWSGHVLRRKSARYGLVLWQTRHLTANQTRIQDWEHLMRDRGGFDTWYHDYVSYSLAA